MCGEKLTTFDSGKLIPGSPPRVRGKGHGTGFTDRCVGITPACAGKSGPKINPFGQKRDHPRVCGEKHIGQRPVPTTPGSPPRVRGKGILCDCVLLLGGITPAYAGKRAPFQKMSTPGRDHPRVCGEKARPCIAPPPRRGSPPAYAGKRQYIVLLMTISGDHPRVCGEKTKKIPSHRPFQLHPVPVSFSFA